MPKPRLRNTERRLRDALSNLLVKLGLYIDGDEPPSDEYLIEQANRYDPRRDVFYSRDIDIGLRPYQRHPDDDDIPF